MVAGLGADSRPRTQILPRSRTQRTRRGPRRRSARRCTRRLAAVLDDIAQPLHRRLIAAPTPRPRRPRSSPPVVVPPSTRRSEVAAAGAPPRARRSPHPLLSPRAAYLGLPDARRFRSRRPCGSLAPPDAALSPAGSPCCPVPAVLRRGGLALAGPLAGVVVPARVRLCRGRPAGPAGRKPPVLSHLTTAPATSPSRSRQGCRAVVSLSPCCRS
jgi:hypothetical protein